ncbi:esterase [Pararobbsia silviterrae]|uniref:Esterase n=2 Tax=Pararobbsia silviterrae TaxID=1792498 RepID=A0A494YC84_9BURK|nr:esterase [Pararobbsia silviterrae]
MRALRNAAKRGERAVWDITQSTLGTQASSSIKAKSSTASAKKAGAAKGSGAKGASATSKRLDPLGVRPTIGKTVKARGSSATRSKASPATTSQSVRSAASVARTRAKPAESRVRPSRHAWLKGDWSRSFHSAPPAPGDLVNHLGYGIYVPPAKGGGGSGNKRPLVVMLHGCKQTGEEFAQGTRMNAIADEYGFVVLYPEQSRVAHPHRCWHWYDASERAGGHEARSIVSLVEAVIERYDIDASRVYVAGMSAGAGMAALLAIRYPQVFAAVALHSGPVMGDAHSAMSALATMRRGTRDDPLHLVGGLKEFADHPGMPAIVVHGEDDDVVSPRNADQLASQFVRLNRLVDASGKRLHGTARDSAPGGVIRHDWLLDDVPVVRDCRIAGLRHAWSGGDGAMPFHVSDGPDSSRLIYDFFRLHRRTSGVALTPPQTVLIA